MPKEADMKKGKGAIIEQVATVDGIDRSAVSWFDMNVNIVSTYVGAKQEGQKKLKMVPCPQTFINV
jgi:hypothetical protein